MKRVLFFVFNLILVASVCYAQLDTHEDKNRINYRRTEINQSPTSYYQQPKEQVFPLGWKTGALGKVTTSTGIWTELNPKVPRVDYIGIDFINPDTGWACGGSGAIIKTLDGGENWTISETPMTNLLLKIHSYNGQIVIATGYDGLILRSSDGGEIFVEIPSGIGSGIDLWGVQMINDTLGWICGMSQTLLKTTDAGLTWTQVFPGFNLHYWSLEFLSVNYGFVVCGDGKVLKTIDGGESWLQIQAGDTRPLYSVDIIDSLNIVAAGEFGNEFQYEGGKFVFSTDAGETWEQGSDVPTGNDANWIEFVDEDTGFTINFNNGLWKTTNRGVSWFDPDSSNRNGDWFIDILEDGTGYYGGEELNIFKRTGVQGNWEKIFLNNYWDDVFFIDEMKGFLIGSDFFKGGLYKTEDGGINYQKVENAPQGNDLLFLDSLTGFIAGTHKTTDGGETWYQINTGGGTKVFFINNMTGWSVGGSVIYKTIDGGENWFAQLTLPADHFTSLYFTDSLNGWATSRYVWQTTDGGNIWVERTDIPAFLSDDIYFLNVDTGWVAAYSSINPSLYKTTNGGLEWTPIPDVIGARKFHFFPDSSHWLINGFGLRYITTDYGNTWINIMDDVPPNIKSFQAPSDLLGYAVGNLGLILRYEDTTYVPVELISFTGNRRNDKIVLEWRTATEINNQGFEVQRLIVSSQWEKIAFVPGHGTTTSESSYIFTDINDYDREIKYRLKQIDYNGSYNYSKPITVCALSLPSKFHLYQNHPNPFNSSTTIAFQIPEEEFVTLKVYDILGNVVITLVIGQIQAGRYQIQFKTDELQLTSGVYFYNLSGGEYSKTKKLILLK